MIKIFGALACASIMIQLMNYLFVKFGSDGSIYTHIKIVLLTLPLQLIASLGFIYYYSQGVKADIAYVSLSVYGTAFSIGLASIIQLLLFNHKTLSGIELLSLAFAFLSIALIIYEKLK